MTSQRRCWALHCAGVGGTRWVLDTRCSRIRRYRSALSTAFSNPKLEHGMSAGVYMEVAGVEGEGGWTDKRSSEPLGPSLNNDIDMHCSLMGRNDCVERKA